MTPLPSWARAAKRTRRDPALHFCPRCETSHAAPSDGDGGRLTECPER